MISYILLQSSVIGDVKAGSGGDSIWSSAIGTLIGIYVIYYIFFKEK
ncbi:hypothetical protein [uncultured Tenacibaculum sp.]|nr:hypothetical protein [uncultured Tenacibaculum sp.]